MKLAEFLSKECIGVGVKAADKEEVLRSIAGLAMNHPQLIKMKADDVYQGFMDREKMGSTGFGSRIAIPHFTSDQITEFVVGILTVPGGVDFKAMDGGLTHVFVFIVAPLTRRNQHLSILSNIAKYLHAPENVDAILAAESPENLCATISSHRYTEEEVAGSYEYNLFHVIVQEEDKFEDLLNVFTETGDCHLSVLEAANAGKYLYAMPLFSSFWTEEHKGFNRIIIAVVKKTLTNRALQKINEIIDAQNDRTGIMVLVQDIYYSNGSLDV